MHEALHADLRFRAAHSLPAWAPGLASAIFDAGHRQATAHLFADLMACDRLFPTEWSKAQRRDRMMRLLETPLEINGAFLMSTESRPARKRYEKTRRVIVAPGRLGGAASVSPAAIAPRVPELTWSRPGFDAHVTQPVAEPSQFVTRADFQAFTSSIEDLLRRLVPGAAPQPSPSPVPPLGSLLTSHPHNPQSHVAAPPAAVGFAERARANVEDFEQRALYLARATGTGAPAVGAIRPGEPLADADARFTRLLRAEMALLRTFTDDPAKVYDITPAMVAPPTTWEDLRDRSMAVSLLQNRITTAANLWDPTPVEIEGGE